MYSFIPKYSSNIKNSKTVILFNHYPFDIYISLVKVEDGIFTPLQQYKIETSKNREIEKIVGALLRVKPCDITISSGEITAPRKIKVTDSEIHIGDTTFGVRYDSSQPQAAGFAEISGVYIFNDTRLPLNVWGDGGKVLLARISPPDGRTYGGGSGSRVFVNNNNNGFRLWEGLMFELEGVARDVVLYNVTMGDIHIGSIYVGGIHANNRDITRQTVVNTSYAMDTIEEGVDIMEYISCDGSDFMDNYKYGTDRSYTRLQYYP